MKIFAVYNVKGGVGKTTSCVNLAYLSSLNQRTLLWDLDPQGGATALLNEHPEDSVKAKKVIKDKKHFVSLIKLTRFQNLSLVPAFFSLRNMDLVLEDRKKSGKSLKKILQELDDQYKVMFIDCPPSISILSEAIFTLADYLLVPVIPTILSLKSLDQLSHHLARKGHSTKKLFPFFNMVDRRRKLHKELMEKEFDEGNMLTSVLPYRAEIEKMSIVKAPLPHFAPHSAEAEMYLALWKEILGRVR